MAQSDDDAPLRVFSTSTKMYLIRREGGVGEEVFRVLKIDRTEYTRLECDVDPHAYTSGQVNALLTSIASGNSATGGLKPVCSGYGLVGTIRFLQGIYLLLVTKQRLIGLINGHACYGIDKTICIPINSCCTFPSDTSADERRYQRMLTSINITRDFFFCETYALTSTLQRNLRAPPDPGACLESRYCWNEFLTRDLRAALGAPAAAAWAVALIHGALKQQTFSCYGRQFTITLVARRSRIFAGTRFLKRGTNAQGHVANCVEVEQILDCNRNSEGRPGYVAGFVQIRGSIPLFWHHHQEAGAMAAKPTIVLQACDPLHNATTRHFADLLFEYGVPCIALNLVKQRAHEKKPRESVLGDAYRAAVEFVNRRLDPGKRVTLHEYDFSHTVREPDGNSRVLDDLYHLGHRWAASLGIFAASRRGRDGAWRVHSAQTGVVRTNCIDCIDRTNIAQFVLSVANLGHQLHGAGIMQDCHLGLESDISLALIDMWRSVGDALARQYGGSDAHAHVILRQQGNSELDTQRQHLMNALRRLVANQYFDGERQDLMNLFLGNFTPARGGVQIWNLGSDHWLHHGPRQGGTAAEHPPALRGDSLAISAPDVQALLAAVNAGGQQGFSTPGRDLTLFDELVIDAPAKVVSGAYSRPAASGRGVTAHLATDADTSTLNASSQLERTSASLRTGLATPHGAHATAALPPRSLGPRRTVSLGPGMLLGRASLDGKPAADSARPSHMTGHWPAGQPPEDAGGATFLSGGSTRASSTGEHGTASFDTSGDGAGNGRSFLRRLSSRLRDLTNTGFLRLPGMSRTSSSGEPSFLRDIPAAGQGGAKRSSAPLSSEDVLRKMYDRIYEGVGAGGEGFEGGGVRAAPAGAAGARGGGPARDFARWCSLDPRQLEESMLEVRTRAGGVADAHQGVFDAPGGVAGMLGAGGRGA
ncbi:unnamed protein product [Pedinophyceae sp. YPF-701]|nr:unnamed protein product [Pedinophyceae sp. YPF-701]